MENYNTETEHWKDIEGYEGLYKISNNGKIWSCRQGKEMKQRVSKGYFLINLAQDGTKKTFSVHRLVAKTFIENSMNKKEVNHIDENKLNNHFLNLEWCTPKENANHGTRNKKITNWLINCDNTNIRGVAMLDKKTDAILAEFQTVNDAYRHLGKKINGNISCVCKGNAKSVYGYKWKYI